MVISGFQKPAFSVQHGAVRIDNIDGQILNILSDTDYFLWGAGANECHGYVWCYCLDVSNFDFIASMSLPERLPRLIVTADVVPNMCPIDKS